MFLSTLISTVVWQDVTPVAALIVAVASILITLRKNKKDALKNQWEEKRDAREARIDLLEERLRACEEQRAVQQQEILQLRRDVSHLTEQNVRLMKMIVGLKDEEDYPPTQSAHPKGSNPQSA